MRSWIKLLMLELHDARYMLNGALGFYAAKVLPPLSAVVLVFIILATYGLTLAPVLGVRVPEDVSPHLVHSYCSAVILVAVGKTLAILLLMTVLLVGLTPLYILLWSMVRLGVGILYPIVFPINPVMRKHEKRYDRFFARKLRGYYVLAVFLFLLAGATGFWIGLVRNGGSPTFVMHSLGVLICLSVPYSYSWVWALHLRCLRKKDIAGRSLRHFENHLFSDDSVRLSFLVSLNVLIFLALLGRCWLPILFECSSYTAGTAQKLVRSQVPAYDGICAAARKELTLASGLSWGEILPGSGKLLAKLDPLHDLRETLSPPAGSPVFLRYLFLVVALCSLFQVALPISCRVIRDPKGGYGVAARRLLLGGAKTTIVVIVLKLFVTKAYLIDFSSTIGLGTAFAFLLAGFLALQSKGENRDGSIKAKADAPAGTEANDYSI